MAPSAIEIQLQAEKASALRRVGGILEQLLAELGSVERSAGGLTGRSRAQAVAEHARLRAEAEKHRWYLIVQREAIGLFNHADVYQHYPLPPPLR